MKSIKNALIAAACASTAVSLALAQSYPTKPIRNILSVGGGGETICRLVASKMSEALGQPVIVEQNTNASGTLAALATARAAPDGYTYLYATPNSQVYRPLLQKNVGYDPVKDFTPLGKIGEAILSVMVPPNSQFKTMNDLVAYAKQYPGKLLYATSGVGTTHHISAEVLSAAVNIQMTHVPYKDGNQAANDLMGDRVPVLWTILGTVLPHAKAGKMRFLALNNNKRFKVVPDLPTITEQIPEYDAPGGWTAYFGPAGIPREIVNRLNQEISKAITHPDVAPRMDALGLLIQTSTPDELAAFVKKDVERTAAIIKRAGIQPE